MMKIHRSATIAALLAFSKLAAQDQDYMLAMVNQYLLALPLQKRLMVESWKDEAIRNGDEVQ
ncbi:hypothetical protein [Paraburkholderia sp. J11-2]|uniref:hypothetical protein n=1 Tax=Paraburkholderia sp. J11-2 TaxID=2805431 RepID=UPI002AB7D8F1|nr:hypothetical protein [Paraburkholderia sp. J11-2]